MLETIFFQDDSGTYVPVRVEGARSDGRFGYLRLEDVKDRDEAEQYRDKIFYIDREHALPLPEGSFYISDLLGLPVWNGEEKLGILKDIMQNGASDVYVVELDGGGSLMFPSVEGVFRERDPENGRIVLNPERLDEVGIRDV